jgi:hypothetical protein
MKLQREFKHGWPIVLAMSLTLASVSCTQQSQESPNAECVTRLQLPVYPAIAQSARLPMTLTAAVVVANDGSAQSVSFESSSGKREDSRLFHGVLEQSLKASQFSTSCSGKTVRLVFDFRLDGPPPNKAIWFTYPNRFEIWEVSPKIQT